MRAARLFTVASCLGALALAGCVHRPRPLPVATPVAPAVSGTIPVAASPPAEAPYTLDAGDRLRIVVFGQDGLSATYAVSAAGTITMPLIGAVPARGLTTAALSRAIAERLRHGYIREPYVAVEVEIYRPFFILGEVTNPGQYPYVPNMTIEAAVAVAGGFTPRAKHKTVILSRTFADQTVRTTVPITATLRPGDTIIVKERWF